MKSTVSAHCLQFVKKTSGGQIAKGFTDYKEALAILMDRFVMPDIKEGEFSISHIWLEIHRKKLEAEGVTGLSDAEIYTKYPLPYEVDFRMH